MIMRRMRRWEEDIGIIWGYDDFLVLELIIIINYFSFIKKFFVFFCNKNFLLKIIGVYVVNLGDLLFFSVDIYLWFIVFIVSL